MPRLKIIALICLLCFFTILSLFSSVNKLPYNSKHINSSAFATATSTKEMEKLNARYEINSLYHASYEKHQSTGVEEREFNEKKLVKKIHHQNVSLKIHRRSKTLLALTKKGMQMFASNRPDRRELWSIEPYLSRRKEMHRRCEAKELNPFLDLRRMVYDDVHKVVMCVVPKAACTTLKRVMWYLQGHIDHKNLETIDSSLLVLGAGEIKMLSNLPEKEALKRLLTYTTFFVSRNPLERLVSAHSSKFTNRSPSVSYKRFFGRKIALNQASEYMKGVRYSIRSSMRQVMQSSSFFMLNATDQKDVAEYMKVMKYGNISFHQLVRYIDRRNRFSKGILDIHWRSQTTLCNPCTMNYDFVIKFENLAKDTNFLLRYLQKDDPENKRYFMKNDTSPLINENKTMAAFAGLDKETVSRLLEIYEKDFEILGYDMLSTKRQLETVLI